MTTNTHTRRPARHRILTAGAAGLVLLGLGTSLAGCGGVDRSDPQAVATAFLQRYATSNPTACDLATPNLKAELKQDHRCQTSKHGTQPTVKYLVKSICRPPSPSESDLVAQVSPPGAWKKPYVDLGVKLTGKKEWSVDQTSTLSDRRIAAENNSRCKSPSNNYGGG
jgi:hypothetical protein